MVGINRAQILTLIIGNLVFFAQGTVASTTSCIDTGSSDCFCVGQPVAGSFAANNTPINFLDPNAKVCQTNLNNAAENVFKNEAFLTVKPPVTAILRSDGLLGEPARHEFRLQFASLFAERSASGTQSESFGWHTHTGVRYAAAINGQGTYRIYDPVADRCIDFTLTPNDNTCNNVSAMTEVPGVIHNLWSRDAAGGPSTGEVELRVLDIHRFVDKNHDGFNDNGCASGGATCFLKNNRSDAGPTKAQQRLGAPRASIEFILSRPHCSLPPSVNP